MLLSETRSLLSYMDSEPIPPMSPKAFAERYRQERERFGAIIRAANIKLN
jgi:hypothetical protein